MPTVSLAATASAAVGCGVVVHQLPVALSLVAVFATTHAPRLRLMCTVAVLALVIPLATGLRLVLPDPGAYPRTLTAVVFLVTLIAMTVALFIVLGG